MPYIRVFLPESQAAQKAALAKELTETVVSVLRMPEESRDWTTVHFIPYKAEDLAVGGKLVSDGQTAEYYLEYVDLEIGKRVKDELAREITATFGRVLGLTGANLGRINFRYDATSPDEVAMGGRFVRELITQ